jgi:hypothetical protein
MNLSFIFIGELTGIQSAAAAIHTAYALKNRSDNFNRRSFLLA